MSLTDNDRAEIKKSLERDTGVIFERAKSYHDTLREYLRALPDTFPALDDYGLALVYVYSPKRQREEDRQAAGITWTHYTTGIGEERLKAYSIGIASDAINRGRRYALSAYIHEAAHVLTNNVGHTEVFDLVLDGLLFRCAQVGLELEKLPYPPDPREPV